MKRVPERPRGLLRESFNQRTHNYFGESGCFPRNSLRRTAMGRTSVRYRRMRCMGRRSDGCFYNSVRTHQSASTGNTEIIIDCVLPRGGTRVSLALYAACLLARAHYKSHDRSLSATANTSVAKRARRRYRWRIKLLRAFFSSLTLLRAEVCTNTRL